ncbi:hypothetical protein [Deinococcus hohokamensis]|uniref:Uncharacterized protein n=1 Tax=Deinococcus hohokamensis TaxID=309883 RepID=A0ABV9IDE0_9DEIO
MLIASNLLLGAQYSPTKMDFKDSSPEKERCREVEIREAVQKHLATDGSQGRPADVRADRAHRQEWHAFAGAHPGVH